jgi:hypothetical protein
LGPTLHKTSQLLTIRIQIGQHATPAVFLTAAFGAGQVIAGAQITYQYNAPGTDKAALHSYLNSYCTDNWNGKDSGVCTPVTLLQTEELTDF